MLARKREGGREVFTPVLGQAKRSGKVVRSKKCPTPYSKIMGSWEKMTSQAAHAGY